MGLCTGKAVLKHMNEPVIPQRGQCPLSPEQCPLSPVDSANCLRNPLFSLLMSSQPDAWLNHCLRLLAKQQGHSKGVSVTPKGHTAKSLRWCRGSREERGL